MAIRLEVDGLAMGRRASKKSWSLELLLTLHTVVGRHCVRRTAGGQPLRAARARPAPRAMWTADRCCAGTHMVWQAAQLQEMVSAASGRSRRRGLRAFLYKGPYPRGIVGCRPHMVWCKMPMAWVALCHVMISVATTLYCVCVSDAHAHGPRLLQHSRRLLFCRGFALARWLHRVPGSPRPSPNELLQLAKTTDAHAVCARQL